MCPACQWCRRSHQMNEQRPARVKDDTTADELREEVMRRLGVLAEAGVIDLAALPAPKGEIANQPFSGDQLGVNGE